MTLNRVYLATTQHLSDLKLIYNILNNLLMFVIDLKSEFLKLIDLSSYKMSLQKLLHRKKALREWKSIPVIISSKFQLSTATYNAWSRCMTVDYNIIT